MKLLRKQTNDLEISVIRTAIHLYKFGLDIPSPETAILFSNYLYVYSDFLDKIKDPKSTQKEKANCSTRSDMPEK